MSDLDKLPTSIREIVQDAGQDPQYRRPVTVADLVTLAAVLMYRNECQSAENRLRALLRELA